MTMLQATTAQAQIAPSPPPPVIAQPAPAVPTPIPSDARDAPIFPIGPIGSWELDQDVVGACAVSRNYGSAERPETVTILSGAVAPKLGIYVVSGAMGAEPRSETGAVILKPGTSIAGYYSSFDVPVRDQHFTVMYVDRAGFDGLAAARTLTIKGDRTTTIAAADMKAAIETTDGCRVKLYRSWGIDPARFDFGKAAPTPLGGGPLSWISSDDYPVQAQRANIQGRVVMILNVGKDGVVNACHVVVSAGAALDTASCEIMMKRGSFAPATDAHGKPIASWAIMPVRWALQQ
jgi:TonB family protein